MNYYTLPTKSKRWPGSWPMKVSTPSRHWQIQVYQITHSYYLIHVFQCASLPLSMPISVTSVTILPSPYTLDSKYTYPITVSLAMSPRTMRRKLKSQGTTLHNIVDQVRKNLSINFLHGTRMNVDDIAEQLGFSSAANFRTAFKHWTNKTPTMYRLGR